MYSLVALIRNVRNACFMAFVGTTVACGAVYPELKTPVRPARPGKTLKPPPPNDILFVSFAGAEIPAKTRDGRAWDSTGGALPDPFGKLIVNDKEIIRTPIHSNTLNPTWPDAKKANYKIALGSSVRVEVWDANAINHHPICVKRVRNLHASADQGELEVRCNSGARVRLLVEPARPRIGLGFFYELRTQGIYVTRVVEESPAGRIKLSPGDQILKIEGKSVRDMEEGEAKSRINARGQTGIALTLKRTSGKIEDVTLKEGPIYPLVTDPISLP